MEKKWLMIILIFTLILCLVSGWLLYLNFSNNHHMNNPEELGSQINENLEGDNGELDGIGDMDYVEDTDGNMDRENLSECSDRTLLGECSTTKPLYCKLDGNLIKKCSICGCPNLLNCVDDKCVRKTISLPNYDCTFCHGFCYTNDENTQSICTEDDWYFEWPKGEDEWGYTYGDPCQNDLDCSGKRKCIEGHCLIDPYFKPQDMNLIISPVYPRSVKKGKNFDFVVGVENLDDDLAEVTIDYVMKNLLTEADIGEERVNYEDTKTIQGNSETEFVIPIPAFDEESVTAEIKFNIKSDKSDYSAILGLRVLGLIIVYDENFRDSCGELNYDTRNAVCLNDVLYPSDKETACYDNNDCFGDDVCLHYTCENPSAIGFDLDRIYNVGVAPIFIYDDDDEYNQIRNSVMPEVDRIVNEANEWFVSERKRLNAKNELSISYNVLESCRLTKEEYLEALSDCDRVYDCEKAQLEKCGYYPTENDILARTHFTAEEILKDPEVWEAEEIYPFVAGLNLGDILYFAPYSERDGELIVDFFSVMIHETLHSFGERDLYSENGFEGEFYQERDCNLYRGNWDEFKKTPRMCDFEAKMIGWKE